MRSPPIGRVLKPSFLPSPLDRSPAQSSLTVTSSVTRTASLPLECWYLTTQRATRGLFFFLIDFDANLDALSSSASVEATRRLALAEKTSQSSKRTMMFGGETESKRE